MKRVLFLIGLAAYAAFIWLRDTSWATAPEDTLPVLIALPLCLWLGRPWEWKAAPSEVSPLLPAGGVLVGLGGILTDSTMLLAASWCLFALTFCRMFLTRFAPRLLLLAWMGFPWIHQSAGAIGWWFRYSGAGAAAAFFKAIGFSVEREGTFLLVQGMPLTVDPACGGLNVLQAMLVAGLVVVLRTMPPGRGFWIAALLLMPFAWLANTMRIIFLGVTALTFGQEFAMGWFHTFGGWVVLLLMFVLCQTLLDGARRLLPKPASSSRPRAAA